MTSSTSSVSGQTTVSFQTYGTSLSTTRVFNLEITSQAQWYYIAQMSILQHALLDGVECDSDGNVKTDDLGNTIKLSDEDIATTVNGVIQNLDTWSQMIYVDSTGAQQTAEINLPKALTTSSTMTRYMASDLDTLERTLAAAGISPLSLGSSPTSDQITAEIAAIKAIQSDDTSSSPMYNVRSLVSSALKDASNALIIGSSNTQSTSIQQLLMVDYIATGNEVLYKQMTDLQNAINLNQTVLSYLNSLQDLMNQKSASAFLMQLTDLNSSSPDYSQFESDTFGSQVIGTTADFTADDIQKYLALLAAQNSGVDLTSWIAKIEYGFALPATDAERVTFFKELIDKGVTSLDATSLSAIGITAAMYTPTAYDVTLFNNVSTAVTAGADVTSVADQLKYGLTDFYTAINEIVSAQSDKTSTTIFDGSSESLALLQSAGLMSSGASSDTVSYLDSVYTDLYTTTQSLLSNNTGLDAHTASTMAMVAVSNDPPTNVNSVSWWSITHGTYSDAAGLQTIVTSLKTSFSWVSKIENGLAQPSTDGERIAFFHELITDDGITSLNATTLASLGITAAEYDPTTYDTSLFSSCLTAVQAGADVTDPAVQLKYGLTDFYTGISTILSKCSITADELFSSPSYSFTYNGTTVTSSSFLTSIGLSGANYAGYNEGSFNSYADSVYLAVYTAAQQKVAATPGIDPRLATYYAMISVKDSPPGGQTTSSVNIPMMGTYTTHTNWDRFLTKHIQIVNLDDNAPMQTPSAMSNFIDLLTSVTSTSVTSATDPTTAQGIFANVDLMDSAVTPISVADLWTALVTVGLTDAASTTKTEEDYSSLLGTNSVEVLLNLEKAGLISGGTISDTVKSEYYLTDQDVSDYALIYQIEQAGEDPTDATVQETYGLTVREGSLGANIAAGTSPAAFINVISGQYNGSKGVQAIIENLTSLIALAKSMISGTSASSLVTELTTVLGDFQDIVSSSGTTDALETWVTNFTSNAEGSYQTNLNNAVVASQSLNDTQRENLQQVMFVYQQFYQSATSMLSSLMTMMQTIASNISSS